MQKHSVLIDRHWNIFGLHVFKSRNDLKYGGCLGVSHFNKFEMRRRGTSIFDRSGFVGTGLWFPKWRTQCNTHRVGVLESWVFFWHDATSCSKKLSVLDAKRCRFRAFWSVTLDLSSLLLSYNSRKREKLPSHGTVTTWRPRFTRVSCKVLRSSVQSMRWCRWYWRCFLPPISDQKIITSTAVFSLF